MNRISLSSLAILTVPFLRGAALPTLDEALAARRDVWGEAAMAQRDGPSYEFFAGLLPPPRYVNADFRYYPIVLSAPYAKVKGRLISNGSGVNLPGGARSWNDVGTAATFRVGPDELLFGAIQDRLNEPTLADGYLPIVEIRYRHASPVQSEGAVPLGQKRESRTPEIYAVEAFASVDPVLSPQGVVLVKFSLAQGTSGFASVNLQVSGATFSEGRVTNLNGEVVAVFDKAWRWERGGARAKLAPGGSATFAIATDPMANGALREIDYVAERAKCAERWRTMVEQGMAVQVPEERVNAAWRHLLIQNFQLMQGDRIHYSAGNQYDRLYEAEGSDAALAMMQWGFEIDMRKMIVPLLDFTRKGLEYHQAGFKLMDVSRLYWQTRDAGLVRGLRPRWEKEARVLVEGRTGAHGLFPAERYAGDISTPVQPIGANAHAWRALRDLGAMLAAMGDPEAGRYGEVAREFRATVRAAIESSVRRETEPPFVPVALKGDEPAHDPILGSRIGSYWNITIGYTIGSGIFPPGSVEENWIPRYQEQHGGIFMGMLRSGGADEFNFWTASDRINPLYGTRYTLDTLRRDDPERALVSFYGMLAQGFTRNTFVCGEGNSLTPMDDGGRMFYCPPNSAANAHWLTMLRHLLVQDWDLSDDGEPDTLRLLFATPRSWLGDGQKIVVQRAPTAFGPVSLAVESRLSSGEVVAHVMLPERAIPERTFLRLRLPAEWRIVGVDIGETKVEADREGTVELTGWRGRIEVRARVARK